MASTRINVDPGVTKQNPVGFRDYVETFTAYPCQVTGGSIPAFLDGRYFKQTGAAFDSSVETAFLDGLAGITSFHISGKESRATFSSTILDQRLSRDYIRSNGRLRRWTGTASTGTTHTSTWGDALSSLVSNLADRLGFGDANLYSGFNPNVVIWKLVDPNEGSSYPAAATEADGTVLRFHKDTLASVGSVRTMKPDASRTMIITTPAHYYEAKPYVSAAPKSERGAPYHVALEMTMTGYFPPTFTFRYAFYSGFSAPLQRIGERAIASFSYLDRARVPLEGRPGYMHCYAQTKNYLILFVSCMRLNYEKLLANSKSQSFFGLFDPCDTPLQLMVFKINRDDHSKEELEYLETYSDNVTPLHIWHMGNAFEDGNGKVFIDCSSVGKLGFDLPSNLVRITLDLSKGTTKIDQLAHGLEFPQANPLVNFSPYRYLFALANAATFESFLVKVDVQSAKQTATLYEGMGYLLAEPVFVPRLRKYGVLSEDEELDGVVMLAVTDPKSETSWLSLLDPRDLSEICRISAPQVINAGLHSHWIAEEPLMCKY